MCNWHISENWCYFNNVAPPNYGVKVVYSKIRFKVFVAIIARIDATIMIQIWHVGSISVHIGFVKSIYVLSISVHFWEISHSSKKIRNRKPWLKIGMLWVHLKKNLEWNWFQTLFEKILISLAFLIFLTFKKLSWQRLRWSLRFCFFLTTLIVWYAGWNLRPGQVVPSLDWPFNAFTRWQSRLGGLKQASKFT